MKDIDLANKLLDMAEHCISVDWRENQALKEAAQRLGQLAAPARLLSFEEIQQLPEYTVVWEEWDEWQGPSEECRPSDCGIAPVARIADGLAGNGIITYIMPDMMNGTDDIKSRWWTNPPTSEQREGTPWSTPKKDLRQTV